VGASRYKVSLRFVHPNLDPAEITEALQMPPTRAWKAGEPRTTPVGTPLPGNYRETYWYAKLFQGTDPPNRLSEDLSGVLDRLLEHRLFFEKVRAEGGRCEFFVGFYLGTKPAKPTRMMCSRRWHSWVST
jgi:hypothetical protein